jgi:hypothetical protein
VLPIDTPASATEPFFPIPWVSPTPGQDGTITVVVQPGEALWTIAARAGLTLQELLQLNNLPENVIIQPGDTLLIGHGTPDAALIPTPTPGPPADFLLTMPPPTPRPSQVMRPTSAICLSAFEDLDRNGRQDGGEPLKAGVAFTVFNTSAVVGNYVTDGMSEPYCLEGLTPGEYHVTRSLTPEEVLTTNGDWALVLPAGSQLTQAFGSITGPSAGSGQTPAAVTQATPAVLPTMTTTTAAVVSIERLLPAAESAAGDSAASPDLQSNVGQLWLGLGIALLILIAVLSLLLRQLRSGNKRP